MLSQLNFFHVGIDWGRTQHEICVLDPNLQILARRNFYHTSEQLSQLVPWLLQTTGCGTQQLKVGIEVPNGPVVLTLQAYGLDVFSINPLQSNRFRDRLSPAGAKDDRRDAFVIARALATDYEAFRLAPVLTADQHLLRASVHERDKLVKQKVKYSNQLQELLWSYFPAVLEATKDVSQRWFLQLVQRAPTPDQARRIHLSTLQKLLKKHRIRRIDAPTLQQLLHQPPLLGTNLIAPARAMEVQHLVQRFLLLLDQLETCDRRIKDIIDANDNSASADDDANANDTHYSDTEILRSVPGLGIVTLAVLLSEAAPAVEQRNYAALRTLSGVAPVTKRSGRKLVVCQRRAVNGLLQNAVHHWSANACQRDARCRQNYQALRQRGKPHSQALRTVGDRLLNVVCAMLRNNTLYQAPPSLK